ncbi:uncharacterized protein LOC143445354 [Clavelina lepadiformis]|uniref:uncharacterized protein LOC143445354 n=1 Tax=Clavelina lepadiformis TaxID=159417 RepID=UPI004041F3EE
MEMEEDPVQVLRQLSKLKIKLMQRLRDIQAQLLHRKQLSQEPSASMTNEELLSQIKATENILKDVQNTNINQDRVVKTLLYGQETFKAVFPEAFQSNEMETKIIRPVHEDIRRKLETLDVINQQVINKMKHLSDLEKQFDNSKKRLYNIEQKNRSLSILLHHAEEKNDILVRQAEAENDNKKVRELKEALENSVKELKIRKEALQALIHASKVDWFSDKQLFDLVISLGEPISFT